MIIDSSGESRKVWKSEVISPAVIVDSGSGSHVGPFRVYGTGSKQTDYTKICFIQKPNNRIRVLIGLSKFWGPWAHRVISNIVVYGIVLWRVSTVLTFYVIPPHWLHTGSSNSSWVKIRTYLLYSQHHGCWCPGDKRSQGISNHDIYYYYYRINSVPAC